VSVTIEVPGRPIAWARPRSHGARHFTPQRVLDAEEAIAWHVRAELVRGHFTFTDQPCRLDIVLWSKTMLRGDVDNYAKTVLDGLEKSGAIENDRQVRELVVRFVVGAATEKTVLTLGPLLEDDAA
jgi:Holliday junction resolvase RusA-like endonuclease